MADSQFDQPAKIELLIGAEIFLDLLCIGRIKLADNQPSWQKTLLGWIVSGELATGSYPKGTICSLAVREPLNDSLTKFWQLKGCNRINSRTPEERACEIHFAKTIKYNKFLQEYRELGHMRKLQEPVNDDMPHFYMPHHCIIKQDSTTTKLQVVFDASSKTSSGVSLNDALMIGPVLQQESTSILIRFRTYKYALIGDLEKMYRQIIVNKDKTKLLEIRDQLISMLSKGGFKIRKWASNDREILQNLSSSSKGQLLELDKDGFAKTLGIRLLGPVIINAKIMIQQLWKTQIDWDKTLPTDLQSKWSHYIQELQKLEDFEIPRKIIEDDHNVCKKLHGFCDASERACIYMRSTKSDGAIDVQLICSKSQIAPIKVLSIPRLELCGAQLLAQLMDKVRNALEINIDNKYFWTDSSIVLHWLRARNKKLPVFVGHRVGDIQEITSIENWNHVERPSWLHGDYLLKNQDEITEHDEHQHEEYDNLKVVAISNYSQGNPFKDERSTLTVEELQEAIKKLIRKDQETTFDKDINDLKAKGVVSSKSNLKQLNRFIDQEGLIRVGGRLQRSSLQSDVKHPYLLHQRSNLTRLIIEHEHRRLMHTGAEATLAAVRLKYWSLKARGTAVHLEVVSNMSTDAFLNAFKRFIGRRGKPSDVFSDNGTNFVGANRELEKLRNLFNKEEHQSKIKDETAMDQIKWHFIPPRAPHFGGLWEATVKAFKRHFYKVAANVALTFEEASTLAIQIESILNSRPLIPVSSDPNDLSYVSAGHFLISEAITSYPEPDITFLKTNRLSRWQHLEQIRQHFWKRWSSEYLLQLHNRTKWQSNRGPALRIGQLVVCREDGLPPLKWMIGRVEEIFPGLDGIVRTATIKTANGSFKRAAAKLAILPTEDANTQKK
ncbi:uncharacterized protein [Linepithema humile]|uniref:uncharacterized protein n=1 Tax=Linepithema humile TaxID=83485 RepID=UPI00351F587B